MSRARLILLISFLSFWTPAKTWAQPPKHVPRPGIDDQKYSFANADSHAGIGFSVGAGQYPIIAMPRMENSDIRVDGSTQLQDLRTNRGSTLGLDLTWEKVDTMQPFTLGASWIRMASAPGAGLATPSSYARLGFKAETKLNLSLPSWDLIPGVEARRSMFQNVDAGHYLDTVILRMNVFHDFTDKWRVNLGYGFAPWTKFGIMQSDTNNGSGGLLGSSATLKEASSSVGYRTSAQTSFLCTLAEEKSIINLDNANGYLNYGLPVATSPEVNNKKTYNLSVRQITFGAVTSF